MNKNTFIDLVCIEAELYMTKEYKKLEELIEILNAKEIDILNNIAGAFIKKHLKNGNVKDTTLLREFEYIKGSYVYVFKINISVKNGVYIKIDCGEKDSKKLVVNHDKRETLRNIAKVIQPCKRLVKLKDIRYHCREFVGAVGHLNSKQIDILVNKTVKTYFTPQKSCKI